MDYSKMTADELPRVMTNAKDRGRMDVYWEAASLLARLSGVGFADPLEQGFWESVALYEALLFQKHGKHRKAGRIRQMSDKVGFDKCIEHMVLMKKPSKGFALLLENGMRKFTFEALVMEHQKRFSPEAVAAAKHRLENTE